MSEEWHSEERQKYSPANQGSEGRAAEHIFWQVCSKPFVPQTGAVPWHHSTLQKFSSLEMRIHWQALPSPITALGTPPIKPHGKMINAGLHSIWFLPIHRLFSAAQGFWLRKQDQTLPLIFPFKTKQWSYPRPWMPLGVWETCKHRTQSRSNCWLLCQPTSSCSQPGSVWLWQVQGWLPNCSFPASLLLKAIAHLICRQKRPLTL